MAVNKRTSWIVRLNHSLIHGAATSALVGPLFGAIETAAHFSIDSWTIDGKRPSLRLDQSLHALCKIAYVLAGAHLWRNS
jgi:hypothetical protein